MAGNNSCGSRSIAYGNMVHNVLAADVLLVDGTEAWLGAEAKMSSAQPRVRALVDGLRAIGNASATRSSAVCRR
jgi:FAD/FMN-containing dehydrogenase